MAGSATAAAQSKTAKLPHTKPLNPKSPKGARSYHPALGDWLPTICRFGDGLVQMRLGAGSGSTQINQMVMVGRMAKSRFIAPFFYRSAPAFAYLTTADLRPAPIVSWLQHELWARPA